MRKDGPGAHQCPCLRGAFDLFTLGVLSFVVSPFIAFAVYFSFWRAARHAARLAQLSTGAVRIRSMAGATKIGIPSLIGFIAILVIPTALMGDDALTGTVFWIGLAIVGTHRFSHVVRLAF